MQFFLANLVTVFLGITIAFNMTASQFLNVQALLIMGLGMLGIFIVIAIIILAISALSYITAPKNN